TDIPSRRPRRREPGSPPTLLRAPREPGERWSPRDKLRADRCTAAIGCKDALASLQGDPLAEAAPTRGGIPPKTNSHHHERSEQRARAPRAPAASGESGDPKGI
ncbi:MAG: hypothetical protein ACK55I_05910, partial [bacterium]